jgi:hypothetical protein
VAQVGDFQLYVHIQDGQSADSTTELIKKWGRALANPERVFGGAEIVFSWASETDSGMYDAINRGFNTLLAKVAQQNPANVIMSWLNADDIIAPGALQTAVQFFRETNYRWVTGIPCVLREDSTIADFKDVPYGFAREFLRKGLYDGRHFGSYFGFVQQEGTFWRQSLWQDAGPLDANLRLAGDWDLWRRFAVHSDLVTLRAILGFHRRRHGQLSSNMEAYYEEVDQILSTNPATPIGKAQSSGDGIVGLVGRWNLGTSRWEIDEDRHVPTLTGAPT